jgi:CRP/FNR family transcriptional regulator, dissimilatory nitrate respiration regulator
MLASVLVHLQHLVGQIEELKARSGVQRVAEFLVQLSAGSEGECSVALPYNKALIAGRLGMKPETLSRAFAKLRAHGVRIEAAVAHIEDVERLRDLVAEDPAKSWLR